MLSKITVSPAPHISKAYSTRSIMLDVLIGLSFAVIASVYYFRHLAVIVIATCVAACMLTEMICNYIRKKPNSLGDFSAAVTGVILALSLPPRIPVWAAVIGSVFAIGIGKMVFGGLGSNIFNPAMAGRLFMTLSFGSLMTTWTVPYSLDSSMPAISIESTQAVTQATPLAWSKEAIKKAEKDKQAHQQGQSVNKKNAKLDMANSLLKEAFWGRTGGCLGETSALALLTGGAYLLIRKTITFHIPFAVIAGAFAFGLCAWMIRPEYNVEPVYHMVSGGLLMCAFFIATDPVTAPLTTKGMWIFGLGTGLLIMLIRIVGSYPEGVMFAVFLMNGVSPLIDRFCRLIPAGGRINE